MLTGSSARPHHAIPGAPDAFTHRHIGPSPDEIAAMLKALGCDSLDALVERAIPAAIRSQRPLDMDPPRSEHAVLRDLQAFAARNRVLRSFIGLGYSGTHTPPVIRRNILENPGWYTQYTPYQAEIAQGRLEALLNFQTMVSDLTGLPLANASLLDEGTAAAEAMAMCRAILERDGRPGTSAQAGVFLIADDCHPQTIEVVQGRAEWMGIETHLVDADEIDPAGFGTLLGVLVQNPSTDGVVRDLSMLAERVHAAGGLLVVAADILSLALIRPPGEMGADIAVGSTQRFGIPTALGGPHAAYIATHESHARKLPGRLVGVSRDATGRPALRLAIQTREQHIRRDRATSNICTAQVLLAVMAGMYAAWHGPAGLRRIAEDVHRRTVALAAGLRRLGFDPGDRPFFDTLSIRVGAGQADRVMAAALDLGINLRRVDSAIVGVALDETTCDEDLDAILAAFTTCAPAGTRTPAAASLLTGTARVIPAALERRSAFLTHEVFNRYHSETEMLRYIRHLESRDLSLTHSMIPLGSCTMKLNAAAEMLPVTWPEFAAIHPFAPQDQWDGYRALFRQLEGWLAEITGLDAVSLQPNAGSQGEYAGLLVVRAFHRQRGEGHRNVCLIPTSAHGTNPASAVVAGYDVVAVACDTNGNIDVADLRRKAEAHADRLGALMVTYPSTHGVFETTIREVCAIVHEYGGQVYLDGANMNAMVGLCRPGEIGADVCHLNLHKTFCIPHGGGGPGVGPIAVAAHLAPFLPGHPVIRPDSAGRHAIRAVAAAPYGSAGILVIPWVYLAAMGGTGLTAATQVAILNANWMAWRLREATGGFSIVYSGPGGFVAHEFIIDLRPFERSAGIRIDDVAKRLMDYGFHAPTMAWPVPGTLMIEPTESESTEELDRFCEALLSIRAEIRAIEEGRLDREDNPLRHAPHTIEACCADTWNHAYARESAAFPRPWLRSRKFWPPVARIDNPFGDRHLVCTCTTVEAEAGMARH